MSSSANTFYSTSDLEVGLDENRPQGEYESSVKGDNAFDIDEFCSNVTAQLAELRKENFLIAENIERIMPFLVEILRNKQNVGKAVGNNWKTTNPVSVEALNWIVKQIQLTGENSILPAKLGLNWKSEFPSTSAPWIIEKKADGRKKGIKSFVTEYGNGILSVEDTINHVTAKILLNH